MASNKSMVNALKRMDELIRELNAWRKVLRLHIGAQKRQHGKDWNDYYTYNPKTGRCNRIYK